MKQFLQTNKVSYNLMSFTGFKSMLLFAYLSEEPRSYEEIKEFFKNNEYLHETISIDTLRVYINSLERVGCEIIRTNKSEGKKYKIVQNPFQLKLSDEQIKSIIKIFKTILKISDIEGLLFLTNLFTKLSQNITNEDLKLKLQNISPFNKIKPELINFLILACKKNDELQLVYKSPISGKKNITILAKELTIINNKLYLKGISPQYDNSLQLLVNRIEDLPVIKLNKTISDKNATYTILYELYDNSIDLYSDEKVVAGSELKRTIEVTTDNLFYIKQRVLERGNKCKVLSPQNFKDDIIATLKKIREGYDSEEI